VSGSAGRGALGARASGASRAADVVAGAIGRALATPTVPLTNGDASAITRVTAAASRRERGAWFRMTSTSADDASD
jgi:hypothetical protein